MGLQAIYTNPNLREAVFDLLKGLTPPHINPEVGRNGMPIGKYWYWAPFVLPVISITTKSRRLLITIQLFGRCWDIVFPISNPGIHCRPSRTMSPC